MKQKRSYTGHWKLEKKPQKLLEDLGKDLKDFSKKKIKPQSKNFF